MHTTSNEAKQVQTVILLFSRLDGKSQDFSFTIQVVVVVVVHSKFGSSTNKEARKISNSKLKSWQHNWTIDCEDYLSPMEVSGNYDHASIWTITTSKPHQKSLQYAKKKQY